MTELRLLLRWHGDPPRTSEGRRDVQGLMPIAWPIVASSTLRWSPAVWPCAPPPPGGGGGEGAESRRPAHSAWRRVAGPRRWEGAAGRKGWRRVQPRPCTGPPRRPTATRTRPWDDSHPSPPPPPRCLPQPQRALISLSRSRRTAQYWTTGGGLRGAPQEPVD